ncbi:beta-ketoacyl synthase N-terminal-like domain-containing protein [Jeotgalibacillus sp. R-1-5s-1]|uniref:beta-ketoacyl synthase N-terminal-like domain-containing protein n=1 Tax=Jeotgalibacillus sp. R-1-5s-1 TaxID=2555897 RepID=UPI00141BE2FC|nr:beta-ketoacyl synthase N-terminal-like domain-containing protein [Jeotgalibacillus sp. R-1-5s-1]
MMTTVVTGLGIIGPGFNNVNQLSTILKNVTVVLKLEKLKRLEIYTGRVKDEEISMNLFPSMFKKLPKAARLLLHACHEAVNMAGFDVEDGRTAVIIGTSGGAIDETIQLARNQEQETSVFHIGNMNSYSLASAVSAAFKANGPSYCLTNSCPSGLQSIELGKMMIESGQADRVIAGATDSTLESLILESFSKLNVLHNDSAIQPGPFKGTGFSMSEGAGVLILENEDLALKRKASIYGKIGACISNQDAKSPYKSDKNGNQLLYAVDRCLAEGYPNYINSQALGITQNDSIEKSIYQQRFAERDIPITSIKGMVGHSMGASGMFQAVSTLISINEQFIPPAVNCDEQVIESLNIVTDRIDQPINHVLITSQGYGGTNSSMVIKRE